jgi:hypothetical protein
MTQVKRVSSIEEDADDIVHDVLVASKRTEDVVDVIAASAPPPPDPQDFVPNDSAQGFKKRPLRSSSKEVKRSIAVRSAPDVINEEEGKCFN